MTRFAWLGGSVCVALVCTACGSSSGDDTPGQTPSSVDMNPMQQPNAAAGSGGDGTQPSDTAGGAAPTEPGGNAGSGSDPGTAGTGDDDPVGGNADAGTAGPKPMTIPSARGMCPDLNSGFPGDEACLAPPDPDKGFQIHIGPDDYNDPAQIDVFKMEPGEESSECYMKKLPITEERLYLVYELSGRPGTHHIINTLRADDIPNGFGACVSFMPGGNNLGSIGGASKAHMPPMPIAPENENLGIPLQANMQVQHDMHYFNLTEETILREFWMNVYYVDPEQVEERPARIGGLGGFGWRGANAIQPGTHEVYKYECAIDTDGRIIQLLGHTHAHGIRETAHIRRANGERLKVFEQYDYLEPQIFMYDSLTQNPDFSSSAPGAHTGILPVSAGDVLEWECEIKNDSQTALTYTNEVQTGEMCNIWGMTVGPAISCFLP